MSQHPAAAGLTHYHVVFDRIPGPESCTFIEVEDGTGKSINAGTWRQRGDGLAELVLPAPASLSFATARALADWLDGLHETTEDGAVTGRKWEPAQRAAAAVRSAQAGAFVIDPADRALNEACWAFLEKLGEVGASIDGHTFNNLKACVKAAVEVWTHQHALGDQAPERTSQWAYSHDGEHYVGTFDSADEAAANAFEDDTEDRTAVWVGETVPRDPVRYVDAERVLDMVSAAAYEECGEVAEGWPSVSQVQRDGLQILIGGWLAVHAPTTFYGVRNAREVLRSEVSDA